MVTTLRWATPQNVWSTSDNSVNHILTTSKWCSLSDIISFFSSGPFASGKASSQRWYLKLRWWVYRKKLVVLLWNICWHDCFSFMISLLCTNVKSSRHHSSVVSVHTFIKTINWPWIQTLISFIVEICQREKRGSMTTRHAHLPLNTFTKFFYKIVSPFFRSCLLPFLAFHFYHRT